MSQEQRARPSSVTKARTVEREEDVVLPSDENASVPRRVHVPPVQPNFMHPRPPIAGARAHCTHHTHRSLPALGPQLAKRRSEAASACVTKPTARRHQAKELGARRSLSLLAAIHASKVSIRGARSPQVSVSAHSHTRIQSTNPRSSEPAGLCLCSHQTRSHNTMKACNQCNQQVSMQRHQPLAAAGHTSSKELGA